MKINKKTLIENALKTVYDPDFPIIDIYTLGLIYDIQINEKKKQIKITMTFTSPICPMADTIKEMIQNTIKNILPNFLIEIQVTFDPIRNTNMIKDPDLKRMFE